MSVIDWCILIFTLFSIIAYGIYKSRGTRTAQTFLLADQNLPWYHVGLGVMATQASAITFLSAPGQGFNDGLGFVQFYFGLPLAMIVLCVTFIPMFKKLNVYTAYEFIEKRFDNKSRLLTAGLFLIQRGLSTGITIYAPAIILSSILHLNIFYMIVLNGCLVIIYTMYGGAKAVSYTQFLQMGIIFSGLFIAAYLVIDLLPNNISFIDAIKIAGNSKKLNAIDIHWDWNNKYNIWSGLIGGFFLQLSYFGTDQSQVGRYLTGSSVKQSRIGLLLNAVIKIPMQFFILFIGVMVFVFYQFNSAPIYFNEQAVSSLQQSEYKLQAEQLQKQYASTQNQKLYNLSNQLDNEIETTNIETEANTLKKEYVSLLKKQSPYADHADTNYVFLYFVMHYFPKGFIGLLIAIIFLAAMGSTASGLNSLASTTVVDFYKPIFNKEASDSQILSVSRLSTLAWGIFCIGIAFFATQLGNLIEAVNVLGSLFYGTILGIFLVAFYIKFVKGTAVFIAAIVTEIIVIIFWLNDWAAFLWLNVVGCVLLVLIAMLIQLLMQKKTTSIN